MSDKKKRPTSRRNLDIAIEHMAAERSDPLRMRNILATAIVAQMISDGVVKGGSALKLRYGETQTRFTRDLDAARSVGLDEFINDLDRKLHSGWEGFTGRLVPKQPAHPAGIEPRYIMQPFDIKLNYNTKPWLTVPIEIGHNEIGDADEFDAGISSDIVAMFEELGFPAPAPARLMPLHHQIAQKLHAVSAPKSERIHDLIDLQLIVENSPNLDLVKVRDTCTRLFTYRQEQAWPPTIIGGKAWEEAYRMQATGLGILPTVTEAITWVNDFIAKIDASA